MLQTRVSHRCLLRPAWLRTAGLAVFLVAAVLGGPEAVRAQRGQRDGVERLREAIDADKAVDLGRLPANDPILTFRAENLEKKARALTTPGDMAKALAFTNWYLRTSLRDEPRPVEAIDEKVYNELATRFQEAIRSVVKTGRPAERVAAIALIGDLAIIQRSQRSSSTPMIFLRKLLLELAPLVAEQATRADAPELQIAAAMTLAQLQAKREESVKAAVALLSSPNPQVQRRAAEAVSLYVRIASQQFTKVTSYAMEEEEPSAKYVLEAAVALIPPLCQALRSELPLEVRRAAAEALRQVISIQRDFVQDRSRETVEAPPSDRPWTPADFKLVEDLRARWGIPETYETLTRLAKAFAGQESLVLNALTGSDAPLRLEIVQVLEELADAVRKYQIAIDKIPAPPGEPAPITKEAPFQKLLQTALPALTRTLSDPDVVIRRTTLNILEWMGQDARPVLYDVAGAVQDKDLFVRWAAIRTLGKLATTAPVQAPLSEAEVARFVQGGITRLQTEHDLSLQLAVLVALERVGPRAAAATPVLWGTADRGDTDYRIADLRTLMSIGPAAIESPGGAVVTATGVSLPAFARLLADAHPDVRRTAAEAFGRFASALKPEEKDSKLYRLLSDRNSDVRQALIRLLEDANDEVRRAASEALLQVPR